MLRVPGLLLALTLGGCAGPDDTATETADTGTPDPPIPELVTAVGFNCESGESVPSVVAEVVAAVRGESLWGWVEVEDEDAAEILVAAAGDDASQDFQWIIGESGWEDRIVIAWDDARFELVSYEELDDINVGGTARAPLVARLELRSNGRELLFMANHLWRTEDDSRHEQAALLNAWGRAQGLPVIAVGDYNFDWEVEDGETYHDEGYDLMTEDDVFVWVRPDELVKTQCSQSYNSVLDFVFTSGEASDWPASSEILESDNAYCNDDWERSDHRPVAGSFEIP
jgi:hypothetical protein